MNQNNSLFIKQIFLAAAITFLLAGCQSSKTTAVVNPSSPSSSALASQSAVANASAPVVAAAGTMAPAVQSVIRIKAGASSPFTDSSGNVWAADQGFSGGETVERSDMTITNTTEPGIYRSERYSMDSFSWPLANGKYIVKLHFAETYDGIQGPGQRVFSFNVQGREFKDFDVWVKAGGPFKAYVETIPVEIKNGKLLITFTTGVQNPQINGIEIISQP